MQRIWSLEIKGRAKVGCLFDNVRSQIKKFDFGTCKKRIVKCEEGRIIFSQRFYAALKTTEF